jgi:hypothetical protein
MILDCDKLASDPDIGMSAWYDPDPKDPGTFVLLHVQFDSQADQRVAHYVRLSVWDQEKHRLPTDPAHRVEELSKRHTRCCIATRARLRTG